MGMAMPSQKEIHQLELMKTIFGIISKRDLSIDQQIEEILKAGCKLFGQQIGIVSRIDEDSYVVEHVYAPGFDIYRNQVFELEKTFCSVTVGQDRPVSIEDVKNSDFHNHPCTETGLNSYIGQSITVEGEKYGTLNFSSTKERPKPFLDSDLEFIATLCDWIGNVIGYSKMLDRLNTLATHDSLTELSNRSTIIELIERCLMRSSVDDDYQFAILFVDLDRFKAVNDQLGHQVGDLVLKQVAQRMRSIMRPRDRIGRYGGDEFIVILDGANEMQARISADRIRRTLAERFLVNDQTVKIGASVGIATSDGAGSAQELIDHADSSMYEEKKQH